MNYPKTIQNLILCFKKLPGIGEKSAERMALSVLKMDDEVIELFSNSLVDSKTKIKRCTRCNNFTEKDLCDICEDDSRDKKTICIVEEPKNLILIERLGIYRGQYHIINGLISPFEGIEISQMNINSLLKRIDDENIEEVIFALKLTIEGETTSLYISKLLENKKIKVSKIAQGIPHGADIDYIDALTLERALEDRTEM